MSITFVNKTLFFQSAHLARPPDSLFGAVHKLGRQARGMGVFQMSMVLQYTISKLVYIRRGSKVLKILSSI